MNALKKIVLCADDFGLNPAVSQGILKLVRQNRLSAVSCMTNMPDFNHQAKDLATLTNEVQIGLHFNLTEGYLLSEPETQCFSLKELLIKTHLHLIKPAFIAKEFNAQLDHFIQMMGRLPDFIDGHQHVHQFPDIRMVLLTVYEHRLRTYGTWIRSTYPAITLTQYRLKGNILAFTGGKRLKADLKKAAIPHHGSFSGVYDFAQETDYRLLFQQWLDLAPSDTLIMCHPGEESTHIDAIAHTRSVELNYFLSDEFLDDCQKHNIRLATGPKS